jgi:NTP pyrophosphatase (non-canonical NTP hydrolase)
MAILKEKPLLKDFQTYVAEIVEERGFVKNNISDVFMLFLEECGELAKAARKQQKHMRTDANSESFAVNEEVADVFMYLLDICNHFNVDLEQALRDKEEINKKRIWS